MLFSPSARQAVADLLGAAGIRIGIGADHPATTGAGLGLGQPVSLNEAEDVVNFDLRVPAGEDPGPPDNVYLGDAGEITMVWADGPALPAAEENDVGLLLTQRESNEGPDFGEKLLDPETEVQRLSVESRPALWIESAAHALTLLDTDGNRIEETTRLAANVLLWEANGVRHRLETTGDLHSALAVVEKLERLP
jgi:hypothetical protein